MIITMTIATAHRMTDSDGAIRCMDPRVTQEIDQADYAQRDDGDGNHRNDDHKLQPGSDMPTTVPTGHPVPLGGRALPHERAGARGLEVDGSWIHAPGMLIWADITSGSGYACPEGLREGRCWAVTASAADGPRPYLIPPPIVLPRRVLGSGRDNVHAHHDRDGDGQDCHENLRQHATHIRSVAGITRTRPLMR